MRTNPGKPAPAPALNVVQTSESICKVARRQPLSAVPPPSLSSSCCVRGFVRLSVSGIEDCAKITARREIAPSGLHRC